LEGLRGAIVLIERIRRLLGGGSRWD